MSLGGHTGVSRAILSPWKVTSMTGIALTVKPFAGRAGDQGLPSRFLLRNLLEAGPHLQAVRSRAPLLPGVQTQGESALQDGGSASLCEDPEGQGISEPAPETLSPPETVYRYASIFRRRERSGRRFAGGRGDRLPVRERDSRDSSPARAASIPSGRDREGALRASSNWPSLPLLRLAPGEVFPERLSERRAH